MSEHCGWIEPNYARVALARCLASRENGVTEEQEMKIERELCDLPMIVASYGAPEGGGTKKRSAMLS